MNRNRVDAPRNVANGRRGAPSRTLPFTNPFLAWSRLAWKTGEMMLASAQVIQHRTGRMAAAGATPSARDRREFALMGQEKIEAGVESASVMAAPMVGINPLLGPLMFRQTR